MKFLRILPLCAVTLFSGWATAQAESNYPQRAITMIVPFPAGGPTDILGRVIGQKLSDSLGQPVVIENKGGGNTIIGANLVAHAKPDGYTLLLAIDNTLVMNQSLYSNLSYDPIKDFEPISKVAISPLIIVAGASGFKTMKELIENVKANPGKVSYGFGTITTQLGGELLKNSLGLDMLGVPYKGSAGTVQGLLSNDVDFIIDGVTTALPHIKTGKANAIALLGKEKAPGLENLSRVADEPGLDGFDVSVWMGLVAPKGTPKTIVDKLSQAIAATVVMPEVKEKLNGAGLRPESSTPAQLREYILSESAKWSPIIERAGIQIQ